MKGVLHGAHRGWSLIPQYNTDWSARIGERATRANGERLSRACILCPTLMWWVLLVYIVVSPNLSCTNSPVCGGQDRSTVCTVTSALTGASRRGSLYGVEEMRVSGP